MTRIECLSTARADRYFNRAFRQRPIRILLSNRPQTCPQREVILGSEDKKEIVDPGTAIFVPRGALHGLKSLEENSKLLIIYTPGGWDHYYREAIKLTPEQMEDEDFMKQFEESYDE